MVSKGSWTRAGVRILAVDAEARLAREPAAVDTPETLYLHQWAREVLAKALQHLETRAGQRGETVAFALLKPALIDSTFTALDTSGVAAALGIPPSHVKVRVHRLRSQFWEAVLAVIAETIQSRSPAALDEELRDLLRSLSGAL